MTTEPSCVWSQNQLLLILIPNISISHSSHSFQWIFCFFFFCSKLKFWCVTRAASKYYHRGTACLMLFFSFWNYFKIISRNYPFQTESIKTWTILCWPLNIWRSWLLLHTLGVCWSPFKPPSPLQLPLLVFVVVVILFCFALVNISKYNWHTVNVCAFKENSFVLLQNCNHNKNNEHIHYTQDLHVCLYAIYVYFPLYLGPVPRSHCSSCC